MHKVLVSRYVILDEVLLYSRESRQIEHESDYSSHKGSTYLPLSPMMEVASREVPGEKGRPCPQEYNHGEADN